MTWVIVLAAVLLTVVVLWAYFTAQRLNRLHIRTDSARLSLQASLDRRAAVVGALIPEASAVAVEAEAIPLEYGNFDRRAGMERTISAAISELEPQVPAQLIDADVRVQLAHRFYNEAVADTRALRLQQPVRALRLGGRADLPEFFEFSAL